MKWLRAARSSILISYKSKELVFVTLVDLRILSVSVVVYFILLCLRHLLPKQSSIECENKTPPLPQNR